MSSKNRKKSMLMLLAKSMLMLMYTKILMRNLMDSGIQVMTRIPNEMLASLGSSNVVYGFVRIFPLIWLKMALRSGDYVCLFIFFFVLFLFLFLFLDVGCLIMQTSWFLYLFSKRVPCILKIRRRCFKQH